jgi:tRNA nucleotidyltransferase (CCA-adding enzyme)
MNTFLVGGAVRDRLLGLPVSERDWVVVGATPEDMEAQGFRQVGKDFPVFLHPDSGEEYALARTERKSGRGHRGFKVHSEPSVTLEEDLLRRDLTINAMAEQADGELVDPYGGLADLDARILRHVSPAFVEDPLRVLRVARFAARFANLGFRVADDTLALMRSIAESGELATLSAERIWGETELALGTDSPAVFLQTLQDCGAAGKLLPELEDPLSTGRRLSLAAAVSADRRLRFAALASGLSPVAVEHICKRLHAPNRYADLATLLAALEEGLSAPQNLDATTKLAVLERADAFRRPQRFELLLETVAALHPEAEAAPWQRALAACLEVDAAAIAASGIPGHEIGTRIRAERLAKLGA